MNALGWIERLLRKIGRPFAPPPPSKPLPARAPIVMRSDRDSYHDLREMEARRNADKEIGRLTRRLEELAHRGETGKTT